MTAAVTVGEWTQLLIHNALCAGFQWEFADAFSCGSKDCVSQGRCHGRRARLSDPTHFGFAFDPVDLDGWCLAEVNHGVVVEAALFDSSFFQRDLAAESGGPSINN